jgi:hypothetical protein
VAIYIPIMAAERAHSSDELSEATLPRRNRIMKITSARPVNIGFGLLMTIALASGAIAQAAAPTGVWATVGNGETLVVQNGYCKLTGNGGQIGAIGSCSWNPSAQGGILTIMSTLTYKPAPVYFNVTWIDQKTINVSGDIFHLLQ